VLALTFDEGPDPRGTLAVLDALDAAGVRATFFVLGERVAARPELAARVLDAEHGVELHGHAHLRHPHVTRAEVEADLDAALQVLASVGVTPRRWRIPWGQLAPFTVPLARERGLEVVGWTVDTHDWRGHTAQRMLAGVEPQLRAGAIVLAHDGIGTGALRIHARATAELLGPLVRAARARGLEPGPLSDGWPGAIPLGNPDFEVPRTGSPAA
jgi:peptidoglycan/xylan/chitin deacetylase (PgdA/CDA1 family)